MQSNLRRIHSSHPWPQSHRFATNRRCLAQQALPRAWMIDSLVSANRSALRESPQGGERDAGIFVGDDGGRGLARGYIRASARCYLAAQSRLANFQPTNTAFFGASNTTLISFQPFTTTSIGTLQFNPDAPAYFFATSDGLFTSINVTGAGIVDNSANAPTFIVGNQANLSFRNASTAGFQLVAVLKVREPD